MEKEDAYHKIHILERQIFEYKTAKMYMYSDAACNTDISNQNYLENQYDGKLCECDENSCILKCINALKDCNEECEGECQELNDDNKDNDEENECLKLREDTKFEAKSIPKMNRYQVEDQSLIKDNNFMTISSNYKTNDQNYNIREWNDNEEPMNEIPATDTIRTKNDSSINDNCYDIEGIIEKYLGPKRNSIKTYDQYNTDDNAVSNNFINPSTLLCLNKSNEGNERYISSRPIIITKEDLNDFNQKYTIDQTLSYQESKEGSEVRNDNSLIMFGSVNKTNETPSSRILTSKFCKSGNKFNIFHKPQVKADCRQKNFIKSLKENLVSGDKRSQADLQFLSQNTFKEQFLPKQNSKDEINSLKNLHFHTSIGNYFTEMKKQEFQNDNRFPNFDEIKKEKPIFSDQSNKSRTVYDPETNLFVSAYRTTRKNSDLSSNYKHDLIHAENKKEHGFNYL